jgi:hypothetical protein
MVFFACRPSLYVYGRHCRLAISLVHLAFDIARNHSLLVVRMRTAFDQQSQIISPLVPSMKTFKHSTHYLSLAFPTIIHLAILRNHRIAFTKFSTLNDVFSIVFDRLHVSNGNGVPCGVHHGLVSTDHFDDVRFAPIFGCSPGTHSLSLDPSPIIAFTILRDYNCRTDVFRNA